MTAALAALFVMVAEVRAESLDRELLDAAARGDAESVRRLIAEGANPGFRRMDMDVFTHQTTALNEAIRGQHTEVMNLLLMHDPDDRIATDAFTRISTAERAGSTEIAEAFIATLLERGRFDIVAQNAHQLWSEPALKQVLRHGLVNNPRVLFQSLERGMSWDTVWMAAQGLSDPAAMQKIGQPEGSRPYGQTSSLLAVLVNRVAERLHEEPRAVELIRDLEARGAVPAAWGKTVRGPFAQAQRFGLHELAAVFRAFEEEGEAHPGLPLSPPPPQPHPLSPPPPRMISPWAAFTYDNRDGKQPGRPMTDADRLASAWFHNDMAAVDELLRAGVPLRASATARINKRHHPETLMTALLSAKALDRIEEGGLDPDDWEDPLDNPYRAAGDLETVEWLLDRAVPLRGDPRLLGWVLFGRESHEQRIGMAQALIQAGADPHVRTEACGSTLLHHAALRDQDDLKEIVAMLLRAGLEPEARDLQGKTSWELAEERFNVSLLEILDPERKARFWTTYGAADGHDVVGAWSNRAEGFGTLTVFLRETGEGQLFGGGTGSPAFWRVDGQQLLLDLVERSETNNLPKAEIVGTLTMEHRPGDREALVLKHEDMREVLRRVADAETIETYFQELTKARNQIHRPGAGDADPEAFAEEARRVGLERMSHPERNVTLVDWPDEILPNTFASAQIKHMTIQRGALKRLPDDFATRFPSLEELHIQGVPLEELPQGLDQLERLRTLSLTGLRLENLPDIRLMALRSLSLTDNRLSDVPEGWLAGPQLVRCDLSNNRFETVPRALLHLTNLRSLNLSANAITRIDLEALAAVGDLDLRENRLTNIDVDPTVSVRFGRLQLAGNRLTALPAAMKEWEHLRTLDLRHNDFETVPDILSDMPALLKVEFGGNRISSEQMNSILEQGHQFTIEFFK